MVAVYPEQAERTATVIRTVAAAAASQGAPEPSCVVVEEPSRRWLELLVEMSPSARRRVVLAATSDVGLGAAVRLGVGGALWLPPSTPAMVAAMTAAADAAAEEDAVCATDPAVLGLAGGRAVAAVFANDGFWRRQLGPGRLTGLLAAVADRLPPPSTVTAWPALLAWGVDRSQLETAWDEVSGGLQLAPRHGLAMAEIDAGPSGFDAALRQVLERLESASGEGVEEALGPVHELPSGRALGWYAAAAGAVPASGWMAAPDKGGEPARWILHGAEPEAVVPEVLSGAEIERADGATAVRVPGWAGVGAGREGVPATLLILRLAAAAARARLPLWVPNVDARALRLLLTLDAVLWIDGPSVPEGHPR